MVSLPIISLSVDEGAASLDVCVSYSGEIAPGLTGTFDVTAPSGSATGNLLLS